MPTTLTSLPPELHLHVASFLRISSVNPHTAYLYSTPSVSPILPLLLTSRRLHDLYLPAFHRILADKLQIFRRAVPPKKYNPDYSNLLYFYGRLKVWLVDEASLKGLELFARAYEEEDGFVAGVVIGMMQSRSRQLMVYDLLEMKEVVSALNKDPAIRSEVIEVLVDLRDLKLAEKLWEVGFSFANTPKYDGGCGVWPVHYAARVGTLLFVKWLVEKGGDVNARNDCGRTPLGELGGKGRLCDILEDEEDRHHKATKYLVEHGAVIELAEEVTEETQLLREGSQNQDIRMESL